MSRLRWFSKWRKGEKEGKGEGKKKAKTKWCDHYLPEANLCPAGFCALTSSHQNTLFPLYNVVWHGKSLWSGWVSCPSCVFSQLLAQPQPICWWGQKRENLDVIQAWLSKGQRSSVLATHVSHNYKAWRHAGHTVKNAKCISASPV